MRIYAIVRTAKILDITIMFVGSYNDCIDYLELLNKDEKYDPYNEYEHKIEEVKRYKITIERT